MNQKKAFHKDIIPKYNCAGKETVHIDILITFSNGEGKVM